MTTELQINVRVAKDQPKYGKTAAALLARCREFYQDPENEKAFQAWKAEKGERKNERVQRTAREKGMAGAQVLREA